MKKERSSNLHITFHDPNDPAELAKHLIKMIAGDLAARAACGSLPSADPASDHVQVREENTLKKAV